MTRKHYIKAANIVRMAILLGGDSALLQAAFLELFQGEPNFDEKRFIKACTYEGVGK
jgi:hypothetical protein